jgi:hypothetical protein
MKQYSFIVLSVILLFAGLLLPGCELFQRNDYCSNFAIEELPLNETLDMRYSELYCNAAYEIRLSFDSLQDSRCPTGAMCIWEGNGRVQLILKQGKENPTRFWLNTHVNFLTDTVVKGLRFELVDMLPYPEVDKDYQRKDYILQLRISD